MGSIPPLPTGQSAERSMTARDRRASGQFAREHREQIVLIRAALFGCAK
jgi:hypothetical protein